MNDSGRARSIPDETFQRDERPAAELGISASEFCTRTAERYLDDLDDESLRVGIDAAIELIRETIPRKRPRRPDIFGC